MAGGNILPGQEKTPVRCWLCAGYRHRNPLFTQLFLVCSLRGEAAFIIQEQHTLSVCCFSLTKWNQYYKIDPRKSLEDEPMDKRIKELMKFLDASAVSIMLRII
jgi:hypothetical protein